MTTSQDSSAAGAPAPQVSCFRADRIALVTAAVLTVLSATVGRMQGWWLEQEQAPGQYVFVAGLWWALIVVLRGLACAWTRRRTGPKETKP